jgi:hypothetical protein
VTIDTNDRIAAVATVVTDGDLEILERNPFTARLGKIMLQTFVFEPAGITVVELFVPVARTTASAKLDRWMARVAPKLFNVHVAAHDIDEATFIEARSSLIADGLTVEILDRALALLVAGAHAVTEDLRSVLGPPATATRPLAPSISPTAPVPEPAAGGGRLTSEPVTFAGYL